MEYGRIPASQFETFDSKLPPDAPGNEKILAGKRAATKFYLGCPQWGRKEWLGLIYPNGTRSAHFLDEYVRNYNSIEFNTTHYSLQGIEKIQKWVDKAGDRDFKFCPKFWNQISHYSKFEIEMAAITKLFLNEIRAFKDHLGPLFLQPSEKFSPKGQYKLLDYLQSLPRDLDYFVELRHPDWFKNDEMFDALRHLKMGAVITDTPAHRDVIHMQITTPKAFIRFQAIGNHHTDISRIDEWAQRLLEWKDEGIEEIYFFVHVHNEGFSPELTRYASEQFNKICDAKLPEIKMLYPRLF